MIEPELGGVLLLLLKGKGLLETLRSCLGFTGGGGMASVGSIDPDELKSKSLTGTCIDDCNCSGTMTRSNFAPDDFKPF